MDSLLLANAKKDIPLYLADFNNFWDATAKHITDSDLVLCYTNTLLFKNWKRSLNHNSIDKLDSLLLNFMKILTHHFFLQISVNIVPQLCI